MIVSQQAAINDMIVSQQAAINDMIVSQQAAINAPTKPVKSNTMTHFTFDDN
jgi:hypothetical protein